MDGIDIIGIRQQLFALRKQCGQLTQDLQNVIASLDDAQTSLDAYVPTVSSMPAVLSQPPSAPVSSYGSRFRTHVDDTQQIPASAKTQSSPAAVSSVDFAATSVQEAWSVGSYDMQMSVLPTTTQVARQSEYSIYGRP